MAARQKMLTTWWPRLAASPLGADLRLFRGFGNECLEHANGSVLQLLSSAESAGHGETVDLAVLDEAWVHRDAHVEQAVRPAMVTRKSAQIWALSRLDVAVGVVEGKLDAYRAAAEMAVDEGVCCFDWSAPDDANPADPATRMGFCRWGGWRMSGRCGPTSPRWGWPSSPRT
jgi:hypothetical protein